MPNRTYPPTTAGLRALLMDRDSSADEQPYDTMLCAILDVVQHLEDGSVRAGLANSHIEGLWADATTYLEEQHSSVVGRFENAFDAGKIASEKAEAKWAKRLLYMVGDVLDQERLETAD